MDCLEWERTQRITVSNSQLHAALHNPTASLNSRAVPTALGAVQPPLPFGAQPFPSPTRPSAPSEQL